MLFQQGCDLFKTRDPESPTQATSDYTPPTTPETVIDNFKAAVEEHNTVNYMRCFVDTTASSRTFLFTPSGDFQGVFHAWTLDDEQRYFQNLGDPSPGVPYLSLSNLQQANRTATSTEFTSNYILFYPHHRADLTKQVQGYMHLYLEVNTKNQWSIYRWDDTRTVSDSTWSYLKAHI